MASPQIDHGYTRIANEILDQTMKRKFNGTQLSLLMAIWRNTYGFQRKEHEMSIRFLAEAIGAHRNQVDRELTNLVERHVIIVVSTGKRGSRVLRFNKNHEEWIDCHLNSGLSAKTVTELSPRKVTEHTANPRTKKERIKKRNKETRPTKKYDEDSTYYKMASYFHDKVRAVAKAEGLGHLIIKANLQSWADQMRLLVENDEVEKRLARDVMDWVVTDSFWKTNILSAKKLRDKFPELALKMKATGKQGSGRQNNQMSQNEKLMREIEEEMAREQSGAEEAFSYHQQLLPELPNGRR
ncbi:hypothetical protein J31TS4_18800 [Paenibacillus sp. J31TS4]|uniref:replication protein n=1 Tax=Paenibacillus sp. J31TS4 TaxID=2807195 RepID=UPI001B1FAC7A|nr:replication protein [Paenibacillus sp. J31TS4]GIP38600.1 hypothetical protein J31TS4_18800 [Paenibacillus sp. J31TS4]